MRLDLRPKDFNLVNFAGIRALSNPDFKSNENSL